MIATGCWMPTTRTWATTCKAGLGVCETEGTLTCVQQSGSYVAQCDAQPGNPTGPDFVSGACSEHADRGTDQNPVPALVVAASPVAPVNRGAWLREDPLVANRLHALFLDGSNMLQHATLEPGAGAWTSPVVVDPGNVDVVGSV